MPNKLTLVSAIVGQNGAGKTSVMNCIRACFLEKPGAFPRDKIIILFENETDSILSVYSNYEHKEIVTKGIFTAILGDEYLLQTIYYSPHYDYTYNSNFDNIDNHDISFDKVVEQDLEDLRHKDNNDKGIPFSASQELLFKNSTRQILFLKSEIIQNNKVFNDIFRLQNLANQY
ncbi:MAG: AAA family ATPase [Bacteroidetes bacterium]|nr:AAA family ATPase [Bacteroidota bacterium]